MASGINVVVLVGNLTRDPESKDTRSDTSLCSMRLAVNGRRKDSQGDWQDDPNYFDVTAFGRTADNCAKYLEKGSPCAVKGRLNWREWETQEGGKRQAVDVVAEDVQFLAFKENRDGGQRQTSEQRQDDDIPY